MADSAVAFLLQNLSRLLEDEVELLSGVEHKISSLRNELKFMEIFLKSSEGKHSDELVKHVVSLIRDVARKAEDVVDIYLSDVAKHKRRNTLSKLSHLKDRLMELHKVNADIENIKSLIDEIYRNKEKYGIGEGEYKSEEAVAAESLRIRRRDVEEEDVVGLVHDSGVVIRQLIKKGDSRLKVVSIIGMGGLGKTTLARKIYNNNQVKELFPCRAWGYVSNDYRPKELLLSLLKCLSSSTSEFEDSNEEELKKKVAELLKKEKYLVVLDDIWKTQVWDEVKGAFPDKQKGSRILITSRINELARYTGTTSPPYYLPFLNRDESWELFRKKVFRGEECPSDLEPLGKSIAETCGGLPLAIVVLAGLVAKKEKSQREWSRIKDVSWHLNGEKTEVMDILKLSYNSLPRRLKPCFLYFGIYPEDYEISVRELIRLWVAEGFILPQEHGIPNAVEPDDIADYYLDELVDRSLVQVASRRSDGGVKTCRLHDLLRDLCISESRSEKLLEVWTESNVDTLTNTNPVRLSVHCQPEAYIIAHKFYQSCTRSVFIFSSLDQDHIMKSFKLARVLHSEQLSILTRPSDIESLIHVRYLRVKVDEIPACVCNLRNLETLDAEYRKSVSSEIWKLKRLRHLYLKGGEELPVLPEANRKRMGNLQILWLRAQDRQIILLPTNDIFPKLRKLVLSYPYKCGSSYLEELPSLHHLSNLHTLKIIDCIKLPSEANAFPSNLTKITFKLLLCPHLNFMKTLGQLTNLQILKLRGDYITDVLLDLNIHTGEFPQLQVFHMKGLDIRLWRLEKGAMPGLRHLVINRCRKLYELPEQLWSLTTLSLVHVSWPSYELSKSLKDVELKNGCKIIISDQK